MFVGRPSPFPTLTNEDAALRAFLRFRGRTWYSVLGKVGVRGSASRAHEEGVPQARCAPVSFPAPHAPHRHDGVAASSTDGEGGGGGRQSNTNKTMSQLFSIVCRCLKSDPSVPEGRGPGAARDVGGMVCEREGGGRRKEIREE